MGAENSLKKNAHSFKTKFKKFEIVFYPLSTNILQNNAQC